MGRNAILLGASGLIGSCLLKLLLENNVFSEVVIFVRKPLNIDHPKLQEVITDFSDLSALKSHITGDVVFSCLGSTKSKTPDLKQYQRIDHEIPLQIAKYASENNVKQFHIVSALGAKASSDNFYSKMKGETEEDLKKIDFSSVHIYQPSLLRGNRKENRILEKLALLLTKVIDPLLIGSLKKYRSIEAEKVAEAMYHQSQKEQKGIFTYPSDKIKELV